jgi:hypothetical protein
MNDLILKNPWFFWMSSITLLFHSYFNEVLTIDNSYIHLEGIRKHNIKTMEVRTKKDGTTSLETYYFDKEGYLTTHTYKDMQRGGLSWKKTYTYDERKFPVNIRWTGIDDTLLENNIYTWDYSHPGYIEGRMKDTLWVWSVFNDSGTNVPVKPDNYFRFYLDSAGHITRLFAVHYNFNRYYFDEYWQNGSLNADRLHYAAGNSYSGNERTYCWYSDTLDERCRYKEKELLTEFTSNRKWVPNFFLNFNAKGKVDTTVYGIMKTRAGAASRDSLGDMEIGEYDSKDRMIIDRSYRNLWYIYSREKATEPMDSIRMEYRYNKQGYRKSEKNDWGFTRLTYYGDGLIKTRNSGHRSWLLRNTIKLSMKEKKEYSYTYY